ncbi:T9SS type B sorting domain-containing protein [Chryseobacterium caseinilyticum]|uniref:Gliding motility-associated C-terminal domain-containing protein n=1 Tax=Chryseobacterium caseinilyticum TaxID=2771428 RepID=A0ABR8ZGD8_9FLAO|nr:T9SS type B sorting domain-containing protein [Chryseobacterium caseinilyticum]MBD8084354.1 gliding motility-associated C-terminal domain-containing protein [Chryseobacterium caseinilyticum]
MKKTLLFFSLTLCFLFNLNRAQTYQLTGNPVVTTGWDLVSAATVSTDFIRLTPDQTSQFGAIKLSEPINLKYCDKWKVEFDFRIDGNGTTSYGRGDGLTFWYLSNPPAGFTAGGGLGIPANANGLMVAFDIFNNSTEGQMSKVHVLYGTNNLPAGNPNIEYNTTANSTYHSADLNPTQPFVGANYKHVEVNGETDPNNPNNWLIHIKIDGVTITNQSFTPSGGAIGMTTGYFGFSSATGAASARQSIKNVKIFVDKVPIFTNTITPYVCINPSTGNGAINLTAYASQFVNNPANYTITYYVTGSGTPIPNPTNFTYTGATNITVIVSDPSATLCDNGDGRIVLNPQPFDAVDVTLTECNNNNAGVGIFNLDDAAVTTIQGVTKHFYPTLAALNAGTNEIMNWPAYPAANGTTVYAQVTTPQGCIDNAKITLNHYPVVVVNDAILRSCSIETNPSMGTFNLAAPSVTLQLGTVKNYYPSLTDAINDTNEITLINNYVAPTGVVYVRVSDNNQCYGVAKITLQVIPPVYSTVLVDKVICFEDKTTLDAGTGFDGYEWSTGATTQTISGVGVGTYWVKLKTGECWVTQAVKIFPSDQPVINYVEISNNTIIVNAAGGTPAYQYSLDNTNNWQDSNEFKNIARGEYTIYVRDAYKCEPIQVVVTVPNLVNVITPNADGMNDYIDYSALGNKINLVFNVYDRYGAKIHQGDKTNQYKWDGTASGRKVPTGSYWYSVTWTENNKNRTPVKFSGWIVVKNRE